MSVSKNLGRVRQFWAGEFSKTKQYSYLDTVNYNGSTYICNSLVPPIIGTLPIDTTYWVLIASKGERGDAFQIVKDYPSIDAMNADYDNPNIPLDSFVVISSQLGEQDVDNAKLFIKGITSFNFVTDLSGAQGIKGDKGDKGDEGIPATISIGTVNTTSSTANVVNSGTPSNAILDFDIPKGDKGDQGIQGIQGIQGVKGDTGAIGRTATIKIGTVNTVSPTDTAKVTNSGTVNDAIFNFDIPKGNIGLKGDKGDIGSTGLAATINIGTVTTLLPTDTAYINNIGNENNAIFDFGIPKGIKGDVGAKGDKGDVGLKGDTGLAATVTVGTVTTLPSSGTATVTNSGTVNNAVLNFSIPKGETGSVGATGNKGDTGLASTIRVGTVTTGSPSSTVTITNSGTINDAILNFSIPKGDTGTAGTKGDTGDKGDKGDKGDTGASITNASMNQDGHLIVELDDAETALADVATAIATHNANTEAHADIRQEIANGGLWLKEEGSIVQMYPVPESVLYVQSHFEPYETPPASGDKSPDNPSTITGVSSIEVMRCGRNLGEVVYFSGAGYGTITEDNGVYTKITAYPAASDRFAFEFPLECFKIGQTYTISYDLDFSDKTTIAVGVSEAHDNSLYYLWYGYNKFTFTAKAPPTKECKYLTVYVYTDTEDMPVGTVSTLSNLQIERASASTPYTPYEGDTYTIPLGDTYYGGYVDWARGVFVKEWEGVVLDGTETWFPYAVNGTQPKGFYAFGMLIERCTRAKYTSTHASYHSSDFPTGNPPMFWAGVDNRVLYALSFGFYDANLADNGVANWKSYLATQYAAGTPVKVVYKLATPVEHPITPQLITALAQADRYMPKLNNVFSNTNLPTTVGYAKSLIQEHTDIPQINAPIFTAPVAGASVYTNLITAVVQSPALIGDTHVSTTWRLKKTADNSVLQEALNSNDLLTHNFTNVVIPADTQCYVEAVFNWQFARSAAGGSSNFTVKNSRHGEILYGTDGTTPKAVIVGSYSSGGSKPWNIRGNRVWLAVGLASTRGVSIPWGADTDSSSTTNTTDISTIENPSFSWKLASSNTAADGSGRFVSSLSTEAHMDTAMSNPVKNSSELTSAILAYNSGMKAASYCRGVTLKDLGAMDLPSIDALMRIYQSRDIIDSLDPTASANPSKKLSQSTWGFGSSYGSTVWSSSEYSSDFSWYMFSAGYVSYFYKYYSCGCIAVKEIPA